MRRSVRILILVLIVTSAASLACKGPPDQESEPTEVPPDATSTPVPTDTPIPPTPTPEPPSIEWIVFTSTMGDVDGNDSSQTNVYAVRIDGSETRQLTDDPASDWGAVLSPDGQTVAFVSDRDGGSNIYTVDIEGGGLTQLTSTSGDDDNPSWSPDGEQILFRSDRGDSTELYTMNADGSDVVPVTDNDINERDPVWSPDGEMIVFSYFHEESGYDIFVMDADGSDVRPVTDDNDFNIMPSWSPDGERIVYSCWDTSTIEPDRPFNIFTLQNSGIITIFYTGDNPELAFLNSSIKVVQLDGTEVAELTDVEESSWSPSWSPDGEQIVFSSDRDDDTNLYLMKPDGSDVVMLTDNGESDYTPDW